VFFSAFSPRFSSVQFSSVFVISSTLTSLLCHLFPTRSFVPSSLPALSASLAFTCSLSARASFFFLLFVISLSFDLADLQLLLLLLLLLLLPPPHRCFSFSLFLSLSFSFSRLLSL